MTTSLRTANFCLLYNFALSMLLLLKLWRRWQKKKRTQKKVAFSRSHSWKCTKCDKSWKKFEKQMNSVLFTMSTLINKKLYTHILYNTECLFYEIITSCFTKNHNLQCMKIRSCTITEFDESSNLSVNEVAVVQIDIDKHQKSRTFFYIVFKLAFYNLILDLSEWSRTRSYWMQTESFLWLNSQKLSYKTEKLLLRASLIMLWCQLCSLQISYRRKKWNKRRLRCS